MIECVFVEIRYQQDFIRNLKLLRGQSVTVGREVGDLIYPHDMEMSGTHFRIDVAGTECSVSDLQSTNSTWLNDSKIQQVTVRDGDEVRAGKTVFRFQIQQAIPSSPMVDIQETPADAGEGVTAPVIQYTTPPESSDNSWLALLESAENQDSSVAPGFGPTQKVMDPGMVRELPAGPDPEATMQERDLFPGRPLQIELTLIEGDSLQETYVFDATGARQIVIGREQSLEIGVSDEKVSAQHCKIMLNNHSFVVYDLESTNGTRLNGQEVMEARISDGDELQIGDTRFAIRIKYDH